MTAFTRWIAKLLLMPAIAVAAAVWIKGYSSVGGGFAAGVILSTAILLQYLVVGFRETERSLPLWIAPYLTLAGLLIVLLVVFVPLFLGDPLLTHYPRTAHPVIALGELELHTAVLFDLGVMLIVFGFTVGTARLFAQQAEKQGQ